MANIALQLRNPLQRGKKKKRSVMARIRTDDGRITNREIEAAWGCLMDEEMGLAYLINAENQFYDLKLGCWVQPVSEKSSVPLALIKAQTYADGEGNDEQEYTKLIDGIFQIAAEDAQARQADKAKQGAFFDKIQTIASLICATVIIMGALAYFQGC